MTRSIILLAAVFSSAIAMTGCLSIDAPGDFLELPSKEGLKLATADDNRLWVREHAVPADASLDFWTRALLDDLVERRGYRLVEDNPVESDPLARELILDATVDGLDYRYAITVAVVRGLWGSKVRTVEYLAPRAEFDRDLDAVRAARVTIR